MNFNSSNLTCKMVHALPLFWNHRYNLNEYELSDEEKIIIDTSDYYEDDKKHERKREKGETALEILQPCLLSEPPISSQLIYSCTDIFIQLSRERSYVLHESTKNKIEQKISMDGIILDFYLHHFDFGKDFSDTSFSNLLYEGSIIPLPPIDKFYSKQHICKRTILNGFLINFILRMYSMQTNPFFVLDSVEHLSKMGHHKCFSNYSINTPFFY